MKSEKAQKQSNTLAETNARRKTQRCFVRKLKIQESKLNEVQKEHLFMLFIEAKRIQNEALQSGDLFNYKASKTVVYRNKDFEEVPYELKYISSQMKQSVVKQIQDNVKGLSTKKKKGQKVGKIKFIKECKSIDLKQQHTTYRFRGKNRIKIQSFPGSIKVHGLSQIFNKDGSLKYEVQNQKLLNKPDGYYLQITCFEYLKDVKDDFVPGTKVGLDMGIQTNITLSNGSKINAYTQETERLKRLQRKLSKQEKGSKRSLKTIQNIRKEHQKMNNQKDDTQNKIVHSILQHEEVYMQDENLTEWKIKFGKQIHHSVLGRVKQKLIKHPRVHVLDKLQPSTQLCTACGTLNKHTPKERTYSCSCGYTKDRDIHQAQNMIELFNVYGTSKDFSKTENNGIRKLTEYSNFKGLSGTDNP